MLNSHSHFCIFTDMYSITHPKTTNETLTLILFHILLSFFFLSITGLSNILDRLLNKS